MLVHDFVKVLDEFESDDSVVGGASLCYEISAICGGTRVEVVDEFWVENGVDTRGRGEPLVNRRAGKK